MNFISRLFEDIFRAYFCLGYAGNSGLFSNSTNEKMPKKTSKKPKLLAASKANLFNKIQY